ncbi:MAG: hypothetical protein GWP10_13450 [Nitrospiraceae bacterium]|nr:hypothetical protein [Nitrospiraceae bacterium]
MIDKFGENIIAVDDKKVLLPRNKNCRITSKSIDIITMSKVSDNCFEITPYVSEKLFLENESLLLIKKVIWKKLLKHKEEYHECCIYMLNYGLRELGLNLDTENIEEFITQVRNSIFEYITFHPNYKVVAVANKSISSIETDGKTKNLTKVYDKSGYIIKSIWTKWVQYTN